VPAADFQDGQHLLLVVGQRDDHRQLAVGRQAVAFVGTGIFGIVQDAALGEHGTQGAGHLAAAFGIDWYGGNHKPIVSTIALFWRMLALSFFIGRA